MQDSMRKRHLTFSAMAALACLMFPAVRAADDLCEAGPDAADVLDRHVEAIGGRAAHAALKTRITKMRIEFKTMGFTADATYFLARPRNALVRMTGELIGTFQQGVFGDVAWESSSTGGPRLKQGVERAAAFREASLDGVVHWREVYEKAEHAGTATVEDRHCHKIVLSPKEGHSETHYYDHESYLLIKSELVIEHPMGQLPAEVYLDDYRRVDGVLLPFGMRTTLPGDERLNTVLSVKHNVDFPEDLFALPAEVEALTNAAKESAADQ